MSQGRPRINEEKKRIAVSVSVSPEVMKLADQTDNKSKFFENSVRGMKALAMIISSLESKEISLEEAIEEIEDISAVWSSAFDESVPYVPSTDR